MIRCVWRALVIGRVGLLGAALVVLPAAAQAERPLTYREALAAALSANPQLAKSQRAAERAEAGLMGARGGFDPTLDVDGLWSRRESRGFFQGFPFTSQSEFWQANASLQATTTTGTNVSLNWDTDRNYSNFITDFGLGGESESIQDAYTSNVSVSLTQQLLKGHRLAYNLQNVHRAREGLDQAQLQLEQTRQQVLSDTAKAYWDWVYQVRLLEIADNAVSIAEESLRVGELRVESGDLAPVERTRLEAALVQAQSSAIDARNAKGQASDALLLAMGETPGQGLMPATEIGQVRVLDLDVDRVVDVALAQNLQLALARADVDAQRRTVSVARHATLPTLSATVSAGRGSQEDSLGAAVVGLGSDSAFPNYSVSGQLSVPLGNRAARGDRASATATLYESELSLEEQERSVRSQVALQASALEAARTKVALADANLRLAEETLVAEEARAAQGSVIQKDVLEARQEANRSRGEAVKARIDYRAAQLELLRLQGALTEELP